MRRGLSGAAAERAALEELDKESGLLRSRFSVEALKGITSKIKLDADRYFLPRAYEKGNIAAIEYSVRDLPSEEVLREDLTRLLSFYSACVEAKREVLAQHPGIIATSPDSERAKKKFRPSRRHSSLRVAQAIAPLSGLMNKYASAVMRIY